MRRIYFWWTFLVGGVVCFVYGGYTLLYHFKHNNSLSVHALILFILGSLALLIFLILYVISLIQKKKNDKLKAEEKKEEKPEVIDDEFEEESEPVINSKTYDDSVPTTRVERKRDYEYVRSSSRYDACDAYVKLFGYGPVLRVNGERIIDMRSNTYYRIQGNTVYQEGSGPVFEISGNRIRAAFGSYLYEISGSSVNKVFGGYFASINSGLLTKYDSSEKYEITDSLTLKQQLVVVALLFGQY